MITTDTASPKEAQLHLSLSGESNVVLGKARHFSPGLTDFIPFLFNCFVTVMSSMTRIYFKEIYIFFFFAYFVSLLLVRAVCPTTMTS